MGIAIKGNPKRKMGLRKLILLHFHSCGPSFEIVRQSLA
jgi:hypothetical protein